ncbi:MAG: hypothetical protein KKE94_12975 [Gammaproteobacteria bacterium]|uniref:hypothetical protein n=1 Tax=Rheinheimera sp. TaxID=1869214 RepID=UPI0040472C18|nr:hypothetical protein [Gammaproteobacteria bacterium]
MFKYPVSTILPGLFGLLFSVTLNAQTSPVVSISAKSHVCNTEAEAARLADNQQLRDMARALVEFKPTKFCFILPDAVTVTLLDKKPGYVKFDYNSQVLYTFTQYLLDTGLTASAD